MGHTLTGLLIYLLGVRNNNELYYHALKGLIFENFVYSELFKTYCHYGRQPVVYFWHDVAKHEIDIIIERSGKLLPVEIKAGETLKSDHFDGLRYFTNIAGDKSERPVLIYAGSENYVRNDIQVISWRSL